MPLRFRYKGAVGQHEGHGTTLDLGRKGIRFLSDQPPPVDADVELRIEWPFLLQEVCPLELRVFGRVLRSDERGTVVQMYHYEFRTRGTRSFDTPAERLEQWCIVA